MTEQEKKDFVERIKKELIEEYHMYLDEEFADDSAEFLVEALEKQIPKKPAEPHGIFINKRCPNCDKVITTKDELWKYNNCCDCGQKLDWSE